MSVSLPTAVDYSVGAPSLPNGSRSHETVVRSSNGLTFSENQSIVFDLPNAAFLDPASLYIRYKYAFTNLVGAEMKGTPCYTPFRSLQTYAGSTQLENIQNYGQTANMLVNLTHDVAQKASLAAPFGYFNSTGVPNMEQLDGRVLTVNESGTFACPLPCVLSNASKFLPLFALPQLRVELTIDTIANMFRGDTVVVPTAMTLSNVELVYKTVDLSPEVEMMVRSQGMTHIPTQSIMNTAAVLGAATSGSVSLVYNQRLSSIKSAFIYCANTTADSNQQYDSVDITSGAGSYQLNIAGVSYPQTPYNTALAKNGIFMGLKGAVGSIYSKDNNMAINAVEWGVNDGVATTLAASGKYIVGIDTELLDNSYIMSGVSSQNSSITANIVCNTPTVDQHNIHLITSYDGLLEIDFVAGTASLKV